MVKRVTKIISTTISPEFYELCKSHKIKKSDALAMGISLILAEKGIKEYDNNLNIYRRLVMLKSDLQKSMDKIAELEAKYGNNRT